MKGNLDKVYGTSMKSSNKQIIISILPVLNSGMEKNEFVRKLEDKIYTELNNID